MKTFLTLYLSLIAVAAFAQLPQQRPGQQPPPPAGAPPSAGAPTNPAPGQPAAAQPGAPVQQPGAPVPGAPGQPPAGMPPGAPGTAPATGAPAPGSSVTATLTPAASGTPAPSAHLYETKVTGNYFIDKFNQGGPVMWPILLVSIVALTVVIERVFWCGGRWFRRDPKRIEKVFTAF